MCSLNVALPIASGDVFTKKVWQKVDDSRISSVCSHLADEVEVFDSCSAFLNLYALCVLSIGQAFRYSPENAFYIFNQQIYFII